MYYIILELKRTSVQTDSNIFNLEMYVARKKQDHMFKQLQITLACLSQLSTYSVLLSCLEGRSSISWRRFEYSLLSVSRDWVNLVNMIHISSFFMITTAAMAP